ncbi:hypothetical protein [Chelativorans salis]|uniref:Uncharacterized protein n=1 Tax=Chelativorans salis TaxID=2978478 RepID=A0ABT2LU81_9HYPH|nr:hypothetical protein [Chelativorans sp. EGI FJ00035]MCT7378083.1 hypothetical protein [Chelativorans sp. EGI FJ00035]
MNDPSNFIRFNENNTKLTGNVAALDLDFKIFGEKLNSENEEAPAYRLFGHAAHKVHLMPGR